VIFAHSLTANKKLQPQRVWTCIAPIKGMLIICVLGVCAALSRPALAQVASSTTSMRRQSQVKSRNPPWRISS
jgi:hypothetical protein